MRGSEATDWNLRNLNQLRGKRVDCVVLSAESADDESVCGLRFDDGTIAWILRDSEGNGPGHLDIQAPVVPKKVRSRP